jgi:hypothetical protein
MKEGVKIYGSFAGNEDPEDFNPSERDFTTAVLFSAEISALVVIIQITAITFFIILKGLISQIRLSWME